MKKISPPQSLLALKSILITAIFLLSFISPCISQVEVAPWGNIKGIRIAGHLVSVETSILLVQDSNKLAETGKERQRPRYIRNGNLQSILTKLDSLTITENIQDTKAGSAQINLQLRANGDIRMKGAYLKISIPDIDSITLTARQKNYADTSLILRNLQLPVKTFVRHIQLSGNAKTIYLDIVYPARMIVQKEKGKQGGTAILISLADGDLKDGEEVIKKISLRAVSTIDIKPVTVTLNTKNQGRPFDGFGGNFRLQNPNTDPQVINYSLKNLRVAWSRVEFPWSLWQPEENEDPAEAMKAGRLNPRVHAAMDMAVRLYRMQIPVILSGWFPPQWAVKGKLNMRPVDGVWGNQLDPQKMDRIYQSITDYLLYLKNNYKVEITWFSFNESDLGINVRQTAEEHAALIKGLGAYFKSKGLKTKMLLGDNSDATTYEFVYPAMNDPEVIPYIGAVSFHSWRGWDTETLLKWKEVADKLKVPLIIGEGSVDAAAWNYPHIFEESFYVMEEINLYLRLLSICQPLTILQWQLTADYSPMAGGGIFGNNEPLRATQRFYNFKQLASTPEHLFAMKAEADNSLINCAAMGDNARSVYAIHIVNNGASRQAAIKGLPDGVKNVTAYITSNTQQMEKLDNIRVKDGAARLYLNGASYITLIAR